MPFKVLGLILTLALGWGLLLACAEWVGHSLPSHSRVAVIAVACALFGAAWFTRSRVRVAAWACGVAVFLLLASDHIR